MSGSSVSENQTVQGRPVHDPKSIVGTLVRLTFFLAILALVRGQEPAAAPNLPTFVKPLESAENVRAGQALYKAKCVWCHGYKGQGDGPAALSLGDVGNPRPRDFTLGAYKIRSTPSGQLPTDDDLFMVLTRGMPGTSMLAWRGLTTDKRWQLVYYIKTFDPDFSSGAPREPIRLPEPQPITTERVARGRQLYIDLDCWLCHGEGGRGNGPSAATLKDHREYPIEPTDLTNENQYKGGNTPWDIYRTLNTGMSGTSMPSYGDMFPDDMMWDLVNYVFLLSEKSPLAFRPLPRPADDGDE